MNKIFKRVLYIIIVAIIIFIIAYPKIDFSDKEEGSTGSTASKSDILTVNGLKIEPQTIDFNIKVTGTVVADESVELNSEVSAKVGQIHFKEGQYVKKGQILVSLNADEIDAELTKLEFTKKLNEDSEERQRKLLESEAISREEYEIALTTLNTTIADINLYKVRKQKHTIKAPFDGIIGLRQISVGSYINPNEIITTIYKIDPVKIDFSVPGRYLEDVNEGDKIIFSVDAYENSFNGEIYAIEPQIDLQSRSINLRAVSPNNENKLLPGQFAKINLILDTYDDAIMIPTQALISELGGTKVWVFDNGTVSSKEVETGIRTEDKIQITSGLTEGDVVITSGLLQIRQGMEVKIQM